MWFLCGIVGVVLGYSKFKYDHEDENVTREKEKFIPDPPHGLIVINIAVIPDVVISPPETIEDVSDVGVHRFYTELDIIERSIVEDLVAPLNKFTSYLIKFLEECYDDNGIKVQHLLTAIMAARNAYCGYNDGFPKEYCEAVMYEAFLLALEEIPRAAIDSYQQLGAMNAIENFYSILYEDLVNGIEDVSGHIAQIN